MNRLKKIVVGVDFSDCSANALSRAAAISQNNQGELHVIHVIDYLVLTDLKAVYRRNSEEVEAQVCQDMRNRLLQMVAKISPDVRPELDVVIGSPLDGLIRKVKAVEADLLVLGTRGQGGSEDTGTLAAKAIRKVPASVLLVEPHHTEPLRKVVVCIDFSPISDRLVQLAQLVVAPEGSIHLLHAYSPPWEKLHYKAPTPEATPNFREAFKIALEARLESYLEAVPAEKRQLFGFSLRESSGAAQGILAYLCGHQADLAVLGTKGRTNLRYMLMGSTAERVVRETPCSLLAAKLSDFRIDIE